MWRAQDSIIWQTSRQMAIAIYHALVLQHLAGQDHFFFDGFGGVQHFPLL